MPGAAATLRFNATGRLDQNELIKRIAAKECAVVQLPADICDDRKGGSCLIRHHRRKFERFNDDVLYAVDRHYRVGWRAGPHILYPRITQPSGWGV
jgi:hypothetical protein